MSSSSPPVSAPPPPPQEKPAPSYLPFLLALSAVAGLAELAFIIVNVSSLPVYLEFGLKLPALVGLALGSFYLAEALGNPLMGGLSDRFGRRRMIVMGALVSVFTCLGTAGIAFVPFFQTSANGPVLTIVAILLFRLLDGLGAAMLWPAVFASVGDRVEDSKQAQAMGALNINYLIGIAFGPFVGGFVNDNLGAHYAISDARRYVPSFLVAAGCFLAAAVIGYFVAPIRVKASLPQQQEAAEDESTVGEIAQAAHPPVAIAAVRNALKTVPMLMVLGMLIFLGVGLIAPYVKPFFMARYGLTESGFGTLLLYPALIIAGLSVPLGKLADTWGKPRSIHVGMGVCAISLWLILFIQSEIAVVVLGALLGIGFVLAFPAYMAYISDLTGPRERGGMIGAVRMAQGVGALVGAALASPLYTLDAAHHVLFITAATLLSLGWVLSMVSVRERPKPAKAD